MKKYLLIFIASVALSVYGYAQCEDNGPSAFTDDFEDCGTQGWSAGPTAEGAYISTYDLGEYSPEFGTSGYRVNVQYDGAGDPELNYIQKSVENPGVLKFSINKPLDHGTSERRVSTFEVNYGGTMVTAIDVSDINTHQFYNFTHTINQRGTGILQFKAIPEDVNVSNDFWFDNISLTAYGNTAYNGEYFVIACTDKHIGFEGEDLSVTLEDLGLDQLPGFEDLIPISKYVDVQVGGDNEGLGACITFKYNPDWIPDGVNLAMLRLFKSEDGGDTWMEVPIDDHDMLAHTISASGIDSFSQWTLAGPTAPPSVPLSNWAILAVLIGLGVFVYIKLR